MQLRFLGRWRLRHPSRQPRKHRLAARAAATLTLLCVSFPAAAQALRSSPTTPAPEPFVHESWTVEDGLPVNSVNALLQSRDGYLWIATFDGLVRFDAVRFTVFNSGNTLKDQEGDQTEYTATVEVTPAPSGFTFTGFFSPVDNLPAVNVMQAGRAVPIRFSLGGDHGLDIFYSDTPSWPRSAAYACDAAPGDPVDGTTTAGGSSLSYDPETDRYTYVWKTERSWGNSCHELTLKLSDGSEHRLRFRFPR
jgi:hypothetical protein